MSALISLWRVNLDNRKGVFMGVEYYIGTGFASRPGLKDEYGRPIPLHPALKWDEKEKKVVPLH